MVDPQLSDEEACIQDLLKTKRPKFIGQQRLRNTCHAVESRLEYLDIPEDVNGIHWGIQAFDWWTNGAGYGGGLCAWEGSCQYYRSNRLMWIGLRKMYLQLKLGVKPDEK